MLSEIFDKTVLAGGVIKTQGKGVNTEILKVQNVNKR